MERKNKVLVVDDEKSVCDSVRKVLSRRGLIVHEALGGEEALQKMESSHDYTVLIVDLVMPKVSGEQLLKVVRARWPQVSVIIITGYASIESAVRTTKLGAMEYLPKPFTAAEITDVTEKAIERYYQRQKDLLTKEKPREVAAKIDVDIPFDAKELEKYTSPLYVESVTRTDIPVVTRKSPKNHRASMKLQEIKEILDCKVLTGEDGLNIEIEVGCGADLMSDVLAFIKPGALLLSGLTNVQIVRTADIADIKAIVFVRGKRPGPETIKLAKENNIPLLSTELLMYEACGRLYEKGLKGGGQT